VHGRNRTEQEMRIGSKSMSGRFPTSEVASGSSRRREAGSRRGRGAARSCSICTRPASRRWRRTRAAVSGFRACDGPNGPTPYCSCARRHDERRAGHIGFNPRRRITPEISRDVWSTADQSAVHVSQLESAASKSARNASRIAATSSAVNGRGGGTAAVARWPAAAAATATF
jgi:hypothetical protein